MIVAINVIGAGIVIGVYAALVELAAETDDGESGLYD